MSTAISIFMNEIKLTSLDLPFIFLNVDKLILMLPWSKVDARFQPKLFEGPQYNTFGMHIC